jgi:hypothetical protein
VTTPAVTYTGSAAAVADFALQEFSAIKGTVFVDRNNDGVRDGDAGAAGAVVYLDLNGNGRRDPDEPTAVTDTKGNYAFGGVAAGAYSVALDVSSLAGTGPAWRQTSPNPLIRTVAVADGGFSLQEGNDFGVLPPAVVSGTVTGHGYVNGRLAADPTPQAGVTVNLLADQPVAAYAAGPGAGNFAPDGAGPAGSNPYTNPAPIDTSRVLDPAPQAVYQAGRFAPAGQNSFTYDLPVPAAGRYTLRLHFAEPSWRAAGQRVFHVEVNGTRMLTDYDVFAAAGNLNTAAVAELTVDVDAAGPIAVAFVRGPAGDPFVNGVEVLQPGAVVATTTTAADGTYSFTTYVPGRYVAQVVPPAGWRQVAPYHSDLQFAAGTPLPAAAGGNQAVAADFDGDGFLDLSTSSVNPFTPSTLWIGYNGQDGTFDRSDTLPVPGLTYVSQLAAADLNGDGWPDLAVLNQDQQTGAYTPDAVLNAGSTAPPGSGGPSTSRTTGPCRRRCRAN